MDALPAAPRIGLWGTFDLPELDEVLFPRIARRELGGRLPGAAIRTFAPTGAGSPLDGGEPPEPLGAYEPDRVAELSRDLDLVVVGVVELAGLDRDPERFFVDGLGPELEADVPVAWTGVRLSEDPSPQDAARYREALGHRALVSVRDEASARRLALAGVEAAVIPDPAVLTPRIFPEELLDRRLEHLRSLGWFPADRLPLVVLGDRSLLPVVDDLAGSVASVAEQVGGAPVVVLETAGGDGGFGSAMAEALPGPVHHAAGVGVEDVVAAVRSSAGLVGSSPRGAIVAFALGRPHVVVAGAGSAAEGFARLVGSPEAVVRSAGEVPAAFEKVASLGPRPHLVRRLQIAVDEHLDEVARAAREAARRRAPQTAPEGAGGLEALRSAHEARGRLLARQRWLFADRVRDAEARERDTAQRLEREIARLRSEVSRLEAEVAGKDRELRTLLSTRTFRYTAGLRRVWAAVRGPFRR